MEVWVAKVLSLTLLLVLALVCGLSAIKLVAALRPGGSGVSLARSRAEFLLSLLNCFAGGVFMGTSFLHLLPEVKESMDALLKEAGVHTDFAVAEAVVCLGFFLVMAIEHTVMVCQHHHGDVPLDALDNKCPKPHHDDCAERKPITAIRGRTKSYGTVDLPAAKAMPESKNNTLEGETEVMVVGMVKRLHDSSSHSHSHNYSQIHGHQGHSHDQGHSCHPPAMLPVVESGACTHIIHPSHHHDHHAEINQLKGVRSFILFLALSIHAVFEGIALGLQTTVGDTWNLFIAVVIHKCVISFSLGVQCAENMPKMSRALLYLVLFSLIAPLGIAIATAVTETSGNSLNSEVVNIALQGISTGTFIYVTFFEVLQREVGQDHSLLKVLGVVLGFSVIVLVNLFGGEH